MTRWKRISLRTAFVLLTLLCIALGIHATRWHAAQRQKEIASLVRAANGDVAYDFQIKAVGLRCTMEDRPVEWHWEDTWPGYQPFNFARYPEPTWYRNLLGYDYFYAVEGVFIRRKHPLKDSLEFGLKPPTDEVLAARDQANSALLSELPALPNLNVLVLDWTPPEALKPLKKMGRLHRVIFDDGVDERHLKYVAESTTEILELSGCVTDQQLHALGSAKQLRKLQMTLRIQEFAPNFTDEGVKSICGLSQLTSLALKSDYVSDASAKELARLKNLTELQLCLPRMSTGIPEALADKPLQTLYLHHMAIDDAAFAAIGKLRELATLSLHGRPTPGFFLPLGSSDEKFQEFDTLEKAFNQAKFNRAESLSPKALHSLCKLTKLQRLRCDRIALTANDVRTLLKHLPLRFLAIGVQLPPDEAASIAADYPDLYFFNGNEPPSCVCDLQFEDQRSGLNSLSR